MSKKKYLNTLVYLFIIGVFLSCVHPKAAQSAPKDGTIDVGRSNPFAKIEMTPKNMSQVVLGSTQESVGMPERLRTSDTGKRVHFGSCARARAGTRRESFGSTSVPPKVNFTSWLGGGGSFLNQTTADETRASVNCTSFGSKRWMCKSFTLSRRYRFTAWP